MQGELAGDHVERDAEHMVQAALFVPARAVFVAVGAPCETSPAG